MKKFEINFDAWKGLELKDEYYKNLYKKEIDLSLQENTEVVVFTILGKYHMSDHPVERFSNHLEALQYARHKNAHMEILPKGSFDKINKYCQEAEKLKKLYEEALENATKELEKAREGMSGN